MPTNKMFVTVEQKEINETERSVVAWGSKPVIDRDGELIKGDAWDLKAFKKNPVLMLSHDYRQPPIGRVLWCKTDSEGLRFKAQFAETSTGDEIYQLYKDGIMRAFSVGFVPKEWEDFSEDERKGKKPKPRRIYDKVELLEISCVSIPSCPAALVAAYDEGKIKTKDLKEVIEEVAGNKIEKVLPTNDRYEWDGSAAAKRMRVHAGGPDKEKINWATYAKGFAWHDKANKEDFGSYKLPFADIVNDKLTAIWGGVARAMGALMGARNRPDVPDGDRKTIYSLLAGYYKKFDKPVPDFKSIEKIEEEFEQECLETTIDYISKRINGVPNSELLVSVLNEIALSVDKDLLTDKRLAIVDIEEKESKLSLEAVQNLIEKSVKKVFTEVIERPQDIKGLIDERLKRLKGEIF